MSRNRYTNPDPLLALPWIFSFEISLSQNPKKFPLPLRERVRVRGK